MPEHEGTTVKGGFFDGQDMRDVWQEMITSLVDTFNQVNGINIGLEKAK